MTYEEFQRRYEAAVEAERVAFLELSLDELLEQVKRDRLGEHRQIWFAIAEKTDLRTAAPLLLHQLESSSDETNRYSCALALLSKLPYTGIRPHDLSQRGSPGHELYMSDVREAVAHALAGGGAA